MRRSKHGCWAGAALVCLGLFGCANFWDEVTGRDFKCKTFFHPPDPLQVLSESNDGDHRARALRKLDEPKQRKGGTDKEQDLVVEILTKVAVSDPQPLCRLIAIEKLGHFKDPRAVKALEAAFYGVDTIPSQFADLTTRIQCQALSSLGETQNTDAVTLLAQVLKEPPAERSDQARDRNDRCTAAARALAGFHDAQATEALFKVMKNKKEDIALRDCAHHSLQEATGRKLPAEPEAWEEFLHPTNEKALAHDNNKLIDLVGFKKKTP